MTRATLLLLAAGCNDYGAHSLFGHGERGGASLTTLDGGPGTSLDSGGGSGGSTDCDDGWGHRHHGGGDDDDDGDHHDDDCTGTDTGGGGGGTGDADLPYDARLQVGDSYVVWDSFAEEGPLPAVILSITMQGGSWRLTELQSLTPFTVTQADCDHPGNRDTGRDRVEVRWSNADGSLDEDHLDLRYCD